MEVPSAAMESVTLFPTTMVVRVQPLGSPSSNYLFMQGGSEGIADDSIMKFGAGSAHAIKDLQLHSSSVVADLLDLN